jgi:hypothetical protein
MSPGSMKLANWICDNVRIFIESADRTSTKGGIIQLATAAMLDKMAYDLTSAAIKLGTSADIEVAQMPRDIH